MIYLKVHKCLCSKEEYMKDKRLKRGIILIAVAALFCFLIMNFNKVVSIISTIFTVLTPFMYGFIIAYIL